MLRGGIFVLGLSVAGCMPAGPESESASAVTVPPQIEDYCARSAEDFDGAAGHYRALAPCSGGALPLLEVAVSDTSVEVPEQDAFVAFITARTESDFAGSTILAERVAQGVLFIKMRDASRDTPEGQSRDIWRAFAVIKERLVTVSLRHPAGAAIDDDTDLATLRAGLGEIMEAN